MVQLLTKLQTQPVCLSVCLCVDGKMTDNLLTCHFLVISFDSPDLAGA